MEQRRGIGNELVISPGKTPNHFGIIRRPGNLVVVGMEQGKIIAETINPDCPCEECAIYRRGKLGLEGKPFLFNGQAISPPA